MSVLQALLYLRLMMLANLLRSFVRRLRQPRYLLGLGMAGLYFWSVFFRTPTRPPGPALTAGSDVIELVCASAISLLVLGLWLMRGEKAGLRFTEAEVAFLFPAPLSRSQLIHYKLLSGLAGSLLGAVFFTLLSTRMRGGLDHVLQYLFGWWMLNSLITLHLTAATFTLASIGTSKMLLRLRRAAVGALMLAFVLLIIYLMVKGTHEQLRQLLAPGIFIVHPFFASGIAAVQGLAWLLLLLVLHYWWVLQTETPFEEGSMAIAAKRADMLARMRSGKSVHLAGKAKARGEPFALGPKLPIELVLMWKNLMLLPSYLNRRFFIVAVVIISIGMRWLRYHMGFNGQAVAGTLGVAALGCMAYMLLFAPQILRSDLRSDLAQADLLKAWPLPGWRIVLGSMLAPVLVMTAVGLVFLLTAVTGIQSEGKLTPWLSPQLKLALALVAALLLPALSALLLIGPNAMALYFPAWSQVGMSAQRGLDTMGLRLILMVGQALLLVVTLLPATLLGGLVLYLSQWFASTAVGLVLATVAALVVLFLEILFGIHLLGERFEKLDIGSELRQ